MSKLINWSELSYYLSKSKTSVRSNLHPKKYKKRIDTLLWYIDCWKKGIELTHKDQVKKEILDKIKEI